MALDTMERERSSSGSSAHGVASKATVWILAVLAAAVVLAVLGTRGDGFGSGRVGPSAVDAPVGAVSVPLPLDAAAPTGIEIPAIGVTRDSIMKLGFNEDLSLQVPRDATTVGWFSKGSAPGTDGPAVFASHINYGGVKGGFADIEDLRAGDEVVVHRADGVSVTFVVDRVDEASKKAFPTAMVYGPTTRPEIRLITCGGDFDAATRNYEDNVIVSGHATGAYRS